MGGANVLHGVSGGTVAFMSGVYEEWIYTLSCFDVEAFHLLKRLEFRSLWQKLNGPFLTTIAGGILTGLLFLSVLLYRINRLYPIPLYSFFFGLLLMAAPLTLRKIKTWNIGTALGLVAGVSISYGLTLLPAFSAPDYWWVMLIAGFFTACGMVWTGISCSFLLLLMGQYSALAIALNTFNLRILALFTLGFIPGLIVNARISRALLVHYHHTGVALLAGLMLGALNKLWPWRETLEFMTNFRGEQIPAFDRSILPWDLMATTGKDPLVFQAIAMMALGVFIVVLTEKIGARLKTNI
jgi:putative membrane protein